MKHTHPLALLLLFVALLWGCEACNENDDTAPKEKVTVTFRALYDGQPLEKYKNYSYGGKTILFDRFNLYLSDLALLNGNKATELTDIEWIDFTPDLAPDNKAVSPAFQYEAPKGDYTGLRCAPGVKPDLNAKRPADFSTDHPLYRENEYWSGWKSYIFCKIQGRVDLTGDGMPETNVFYHTGSDAVFFSRDFSAASKPIAVDGETEIVVEIDLKKVLTFKDGPLDLSVLENRETSHNASNLTLGKKVMENFSNGIVVKH
jgi:hypothetical protein